MFDSAPDVPWLLAWVLVPLVLGAWLILGWWHCFSSDRLTGGLLLFLVACAAWLTLVRLGDLGRLPPGSGQPWPPFRVLAFLLGWVVGFGWAALVVVDRAYRGDSNWLREYSQRQRDPKRAGRQQVVGAFGALQLLVVLVMLIAYLAATDRHALIYSFALGTPVGALLFLFVWQHRAP